MCMFLTAECCQGDTFWCKHFNPYFTILLFNTFMFLLLLVTKMDVAKQFDKGDPQFKVSKQTIQTFF